MNKITLARVSGYDAAISQAAHADVHVIAAEGELDEEAVTALGDEIVGLACAGKQNMVLELSGVFHVDYRAVRLLAARAAFLRKTGGDLKLCGLSPYLAAIVRASGLYETFEIHEDAESAAAAFAEDLFVG
jgi:anti-anti-sigma factor